MGMELSTWCNERKNFHDDGEEKKYLLRFDKIPIELEHEFDVGRCEIFHGLDKVAERILDLYKKDPSHHVGFRNSFSEKGKEGLDDYVHLERDYTHSSRRLYNHEFEQLKMIVVSGLKKK